MSETKKTDEQVAAIESHATPHLSGAEAQEVRKHIEDHVAGMRKDFAKMMEERAKGKLPAGVELSDTQRKALERPTPATVIAFHEIAAEVASAEHAMDKNKPHIAVSNDARIAFERALEQRAAAEIKMHEAVHGKAWYHHLRSLDASRAWKVVRDHPIPSAIGGGLGGFGLWKLLEPIVTAEAAPAWFGSLDALWKSIGGYSMANAGIIGLGAYGGGILGRLIGGYIAKKTGMDVSSAKKAGSAIGAGGTAFALSFVVPGGQLALALAGGGWLGWKLIQYGTRRWRQERLHLTPDQEAIEKEKMKLLPVYDTQDPSALKSGCYDFKTNEFAKEIQEFRVRLQKIETFDEDNKNLDRAREHDKKLLEAIAKLQETKDKKEAREAREAAESAVSELIRTVVAAEKFAEKAKGKDRKACDRARGVGGELTVTLENLRTHVLERMGRDAAKLPANWDVIQEALVSADSAIAAANIPVDSTMEAEEAEKIATKAVDAMTRLRSLIEKAAEMKQTTQVEEAKHAHAEALRRAKAQGDTDLREPLYKARAAYLSAMTDRVRRSIEPPSAA